MLVSFTAAAGTVADLGFGLGGGGTAAGFGLAFGGGGLASATVSSSSDCSSSSGVA